MRWRKPRPIEVVALAGGVLAAGTVLVMFNRMSGFMGRTTPEPQLISGRVSCRRTMALALSRAIASKRAGGTATCCGMWRTKRGAAGFFQSPNSSSISAASPSGSAPATLTWASLADQ